MVCLTYNPYSTMQCRRMCSKSKHLKKQQQQRPKDRTIITTKTRFNKKHVQSKLKKAMTNEEIKNLFNIVPTNEEGNDFVIIVGNHLATEKHFESKLEASLYIDKKEWDLIFALIAEMIESHEQFKNKETNEKDNNQK